jgi:hypothetical protein
LLVAAAIFLGGCSVESPTNGTPEASQSPPDYVWPLLAGDWGRLRLLVYDDAGLLVGLRASTDPGRSDVSWWIPVADEPDSIVLGWIGGVCADPTLRISRQGDQTSLVVTEGIFQGASGEACPAVGIAYSVMLTFRDPVSTLGISFRASN